MSGMVHLVEERQRSILKARPAALISAQNALSDALELPLKGILNGSGKDGENGADLEISTCSFFKKLVPQRSSSINKIAQVRFFAN